VPSVAVEVVIALVVVLAIMVLNDESETLTSTL
jgi:hypothetical protein